MDGYPAEYIIRDRVKENKKWIINMVDGRELLHELTNVIPQEQIHYIRDKDARREATQELIDILEKSQRPGRWICLLQALEKNDYPYLATVLKAEEEIDNLTLKIQMHCIDYNCKEIEERIDPVDIARFLLQFGTLTRSDLEQIEKVMETKGRTHAARKLLSLMPNREKDWYVHFLEALQRNYFGDLGDKIRNTIWEDTSNANVAQEEVNRPLARVLYVLKKSFPRDATYQHLADCAYLPDGRLVVIDSDRNKLLLFDASITLQAQHNVDTHPSGICVSADGTFIHVLHQDGTFVIYTLLGGFKEVHRVKLNLSLNDSGFSGVGVSWDTIITGHKDNITLFNINGEKLSSIEKKGYNTLICMSQDGSMFYHRDGNDIVCRSVSDLSEISRLSHLIINKPWGIACDRHGNILVTGRKCLTTSLFSGNIVLISKDLSRAIELVDNFAILDPPVICCHPNSDEFVVISNNILVKEDAVAMQVYEMKYTE